MQRGVCVREFHFTFWDDKNENLGPLFNSLDVLMVPGNVCNLC